MWVWRIERSEFDGVDRRTVVLGKGESWIFFLNVENLVDRLIRLIRIGR